MECERVGFNVPLDTL